MFVCLRALGMVRTNLTQIEMIPVQLSIRCHSHKRLGFLISSQILHFIFYTWNELFQQHELYRTRRTLYRNYTPYLNKESL